MLGIHIRGSDGGFIDIDWYNIIEKLLIICEKWCSNKDNGVFLTADKFEYFTEFSKLGTKLFFYFPPKVLENTISIDESNTKFNNDKYNVLSGLVDMYLLSHCNRYIIGTTDSTFSFCGMLLASDTTEKYLINSVTDVENLNLF
jgi:hypothetical protein